MLIAFEPPTMTGMYPLEERKRAADPLFGSCMRDWMDSPSLLRKRLMEKDSTGLWREDFGFRELLLL